MIKSIKQQSTLLMLYHSWDELYRERFVKQALTHARKHPGIASTKRLYEAIDQRIGGIRGFRQPSKAIAVHFENICEAVVNHLVATGVLEALLPVWVESLPTLRATVLELFATHDITPLEKFRGKLQEAEAGSNIPAVIAALQAVKIGSEFEDARVMIICLSGQYYDVSQDANDRIASDATDETSWEIVLHTLESSNPDDNDFDEGVFETFIVQALELVKRKREQRGGRDILTRTIQQLREAHVEQIMFHELDGVNTWRAEHVELSDCHQLVEKVTAFSGTLAEDVKVRQDQVQHKTRSERDALQPAIIELNQQIDAAYQSLNAVLGANELVPLSLLEQAFEDQVAVASEQAELLQNEEPEVFTASVGVQLEEPTAELAHNVEEAKFARETTHEAILSAQMGHDKAEAAGEITKGCPNN